MENQEINDVGQFQAPRKLGNPNWFKGMARPDGAFNRADNVKESRDVSALARRFGPKMIRVLRSIAVDRKEKSSARIAAANSILDRGYGRPSQTVKIDQPQDRAALAQALGDAASGAVNVLKGLPAGSVEVLPPLAKNGDALAEAAYSVGVAVGASMASESGQK